MSKELEREDRLDEKLSGQSHDERLIDSVCAELNAMAFDLKAAHTVNGDWPGSERDILEKHDHLKRMAVELRKLKAARAQGVTAAMTRIAKKKLEQMGATVHGVLAKNEVGRWVAVSESGRVMWLDNFEGRDSSVQPEQPSAGVVPKTKEIIDRVVEELENGFVRCERCGDQEDTATLDCMIDLKRLQSLLAAAPTAPAVQGGDAAGGLPLFDPSRPREEQGIFGKFIVRRVDGSDLPGGKHHGCRYFVLDVDHDKFAPAALGAYADQCESQYPELAKDLRKQFGAAQAVQGGGVPVAWMVSHPDHAWRVYDAYPSWAEGEFQIDPLYTHPHNGEQGGEWDDVRRMADKLRKMREDAEEFDGDRREICASLESLGGKLIEAAIDATQPPKSKEE